MVEEDTQRLCGDPFPHIKREGDDLTTCTLLCVQVVRSSSSALFIVVCFQMNDKLNDLRYELFSLIRHRIISSESEDNSTIREKLLTSFKRRQIQYQDFRNRL